MSINVLFLFAVIWVLHEVKKQQEESKIVTDITQVTGNETEQEEGPDAEKWINDNGAATKEQVPATSPTKIIWTESQRGEACNQRDPPDVGKRMPSGALASTSIFEGMVVQMSPLAQIVELKAWQESKNDKQQECETTITI